MSETPLVDGRTSDEIRDDVVSLVPNYVETWNPADDPVGGAVLTLFAEMAATVVSDLDGLPEKHFVAFLDSLGFDRNPPQRARLPLSVAVADGARRNVVVPSGTRVTATGEDGAKHVFEVTPGGGFEATPANLRHVYAADPATDRIYDVLSPLAAGAETPLFGGRDRQRHEWYLGHPDLLTLDADSRFLVRVETSAAERLFTDVLRWEYYGTVDGDDTEAWRELVQVREGAETTPARPTTVDDVYERLRPMFATYGYADLSTLPSNRRRAVVRNLVSAASTVVRDTNSSGPSETPSDVDRAFLDAVARVVRELQSDVDRSSGDRRWLSLLFERPPGAEMTEREVGGVETMWIRATLPSDTLLANDVVVSDVRFASGPSLGTRTPSDGKDEAPGDADGPSSLSPDALFHNDVPLRIEADEDVLPYGETPQSRDAFYVSSVEAFSKSGTDVTLQFQGASGLFDERRHLSWEYWNGDGWGPLPALSSDGETLSFTVPEDFEGTRVAGHEGRWIRARLLDNEYGQVKYRRVPFEEIVASSANQPNQTFEFDNPPVDEVSIFVLESVGGGAAEWIRWHEVTTFGDSGPNDRHYVVDEEAGTVTFGDGTDGMIPPAGTDNVKAAYRGGTYDWTLEKDDVPYFRTFTIDYGTEDHDVVPPSGVGTPTRSRLHVADPMWVTSFNNLTYETHASPESGEFLGSIRPFAGLDDETQTVYLGFDAPLTDGPIPLLVAVAEKLFPDGFEPRVRWEYCVDTEGGEWEAAAVHDETEGLTERGVVSLSFPSETVASRRFGTEMHWVRARIADDPFGYDFAPLFEASRPSDAASDSTLPPCESSVSTRPPLATPSPSPPTLEGVYPNTGWAANVQSFESEPLGSSDGTPAQTFVLRSSPATNAAVEVDELAVLSASERTALAETRPDDVVEPPEEGDDPDSFWVRWTPVADLDASAPGDRHYTFDWTTGAVTFGDGVNGRIPPAGRDNVRASYETGGGARGNVPAGAVERLVSSLAFVEEVSNPEAADGGVDAETTPQVLRRAPEELRDRNRAVTLEDLERIAGSSSRGLARVRAIAAMGPAGEYAPGKVTLVVVPQSEAVRPTPSVELRRRVLEGVREYAPATLTADDRLVVRGPSFVSASASADIVARRGTSLSSLEATVDATLTEYLHPLTGGSSDSGWGFGELPCLSDLFALVERVDGVDHVETLALSFEGDGGGAPLTVTPGDEEPSVAVDALVYSGGHDVSVTGER